MNKINNFTFAYLKWASPLAAIAATLSALGKSGNSIIYWITGVATFIWILFLIYLVFALVFQNSLRNQFVRWIAGIKENDERESIIAGNSSKNTFIFMTCFIIFLLFLSIFKVEIFRHKQPNTDGKKNGEIKISFAANFVPPSEELVSQKKVNDDRDYIVNYQRLPLALDGALILISLFQIGSFYYFSRKEKMT